jgi:hypothetical protein
MRFGKKRLLVGASVLAGLGGAAALVAGTTFGLFSGSAPGSANSFHSGTVSLAATATATIKCTVTNMVPGDESTGYTPSAADNTQSPKDTTCVAAFTYTGSVPAYIGVSSAASGTLPLLWEINATSTTQPGPFASAGVINTNTATDPLYVAKATGGTTHTYKIYVDYLLPRTDTTQSANSATLTLTLHAVQSGNNGTGATCHAGSQCTNTATGVRSWS